MKCINCGSQIPDDSLFCNKCGMPLENNEISGEENDSEKVANIELEETNAIAIENKEIKELNNAEVKNQGKKISLKQKITLGCVVTAVLFLGIFIWQYTLTNRLKELYADGDYWGASDVADGIFLVLDKEVLILKDKLVPLKEPSLNLEIAEDFKYETNKFAKEMYHNFLIKALASYIGWYDVAKEKNCIS